MALTKIEASNIAAGAVVTDTTAIEDDIALLGFKVASNGSLAKYNLVDQTIDVFEDATGIDTSASTGEYLTASNYYTNALSAAVTVTSGLLSQSGLGGWSAANLVDGNIATNGFYTDSSAAGSYMRIDFGSGTEKSLSEWRYYVDGTVTAVWNIQYSSDAVSWTNAYVGFDSNSPSGAGWKTVLFNAPASEQRYWQSYKTDAAVGGNWHTELLVYNPTFTGTMSLVSNATTAEDGAPTKGDLVITYTDGAGTATVNTDLKAYISRDGSAYTSAVTLTDQGTSGGHKILTAHDVDLSGIASGTSMRWKIETLNQAVAKETRIQAVSLGWS